jgi:hypothetical protein
MKVARVRSLSKISEAMDVPKTLLYATDVARFHGRCTFRNGRRTGGRSHINSTATWNFFTPTFVDSSAFQAIRTEKERRGPSTYSSDY